MKLGVDTTSFRNARLSQPDSNDPAPVVGMGATVLGRSSRRAATVVEVLNDSERVLVAVREDLVAPEHAEGGSAVIHGFLPNASGSKYWFLLTKAGVWQCVKYDSRDKRWYPRAAIGLKLNLRESHGSDSIN